MLELGAGLSLPSIVAAKFGHPKVVVSRYYTDTRMRPCIPPVCSFLSLCPGACCWLLDCPSDYPDKLQLDNIRHNAATNLNAEQLKNFHVVGHEWGSSVAPLLELTRVGGEEEQGFDLVVMADLVYKGSLHTELLQSASASLGFNTQGRILVSWDKSNQPAELPASFLKMAEQAPHYLFEVSPARLVSGDVTVVLLQRRLP